MTQSPEPGGPGPGGPPGRRARLRVSPGPAVTVRRSRGLAGCFSPDIGRCGSSRLSPTAQRDASAEYDAFELSRLGRPREPSVSCDRLFYGVQQL